MPQLIRKVIARVPCDLQICVRDSSPGTYFFNDKTTRYDLKKVFPV